MPKVNTKVYLVSEIIPMAEEMTKLITDFDDSIDSIGHQIVAQINDVISGRDREDKKYLLIFLSWAFAAKSLLKGKLLLITETFSFSSSKDKKTVRDFIKDI